MATVIDALLVTLNLDATGFQKGQKDTSEALKNTREDANKTAKDMQAAGAKASEYYSALKKAASSLLAVVGAGELGNFAIKQVDAMRSIQIAASSMNMPTDKVHAYTKWIQVMGGSAETATQTLQKLSQLRVMPWEANTDQLIAFNAIGGQIREDPLETIRKFADWAHEQPAANRPLIYRLGHNLGMSDAEINAAQTSGGAGMNAGMASRLAMTDAQLAQMAKTQEAWRNFVQTFTWNLDQLVANPEAAKVLDAVTALMKEFPGVTQAIFGLAAAIVVLGSAAVAGTLLGIPKILPGAGGGGAGAGGSSQSRVALIRQPPRGLGLLGFGSLALPAVLATAAFTLHGDTDTSAGAQKVRARQRQEDIDRGIDPYTGMPISVSAADIAKRLGKSSASVPAAAGSVASYIKSLGFSDAQTQGILAGILAESGGKIDARPYDPKTGKYLSTAYGIGQWTASSGRQADFARVFGHDIHGSSLPEQLQFLAWEMKNSHAGAAGAIRGQKTAAGALDAFIRLFESPASGAQFAGDIARGSRYLAGAGSQTAINISTINVNVAHGDPAKIAQGIGSAIQRNGLVTQANRGLS